MAVKVGDKAPDFKLFDSDKKEVSLSDYKGKNVVILFFPLAFSGVCTKEMCSMRDDIGNYSDLNAEVLGVSVDSVFSLDAFKKAEGLPFRLLSDFNKDTSKEYGALFDDFAFGMHGVSKRSAFVVDKDGIIRYAEVMPTPPELPNFDAVKETLKKLG
jgi:peroxiredoxin